MELFMKYTERSIQEFLSSIEINDKVNIGKKAIGANFKRMRETAGLTQKNVSDFLRMTPQNIYKFEKGERSFHYSVVCRLCDYMNANVDDLFIGPKEICLTYTYLTQFIDNRDKLSFVSPSTNKTLTKAQERQYNSLKKWCTETLKTNGVLEAGFGISFGVRNSTYPVFSVSFPKKSNSKIIKTFVENDFTLSQRKQSLGNTFQEIVIAVLSKELEV